MKINFFQKSKNTFRVKKGNINPNIYWMWVFVLGFIVVLASFGFGFYLFHTVNKDYDASELIQAQNNKIITKDKINHSLDYFSKRTEDSNQILVNPAGVTDPSL
jgi:hypothetical protein